MNESSLQAISPLEGYTRRFDDTLLSEKCGLVIIGVARPLEGGAALDQALKNYCRLVFPDVGTCLRSYKHSKQGSVASITLLGWQRDQCLLVLDSEQPAIDIMGSNIHTALNAEAYLTDVSDALAVLEIEGSHTLAAMERVCMLDLSRFDTTRVLRTSMQHISVIIETLGTQHVRLFTPRSTAESFLHTITTALTSVTDI